MLSLTLLKLIIIHSLDRLAYEHKDKVAVQLQLENNSAVDVLGSTLKVVYLYVIIILIIFLLTAGNQSNQALWTRQSKRRGGTFSPYSI